MGGKLIGAVGYAVALAIRTPQFCKVGADVVK
jgi:hypothetical protein